MKLSALLAAGVLVPLCGTGDASFAAELSASSRITSVTVYADRALVVRTVKVSVEPGEHAILVPGLPPSLAEDSVMASIRSGPAKLMGLEVRKKFGSEARDAWIRQLEREIEQLEDKIKEIGARIEADKKAMDFADRLQLLKAEQPAKEFGTRPFSPSDWDAAVKYLAGLRISRMTAIIAAERDRGAVSRLLDAKRRDYAQQTADRGTDSLVVALLVVAREGGELTGELKYLVNGARWSPLYDARGDAGNKLVDLTYAAEVIQGTGESWDDVDLLLSTARPSLGAQVPGLQAVYLNTRNLGIPQAERVGVRLSREGLPTASAATAMSTADRPLPSGVPASPSAGWETTAVETAPAGVSAVYHIPRRQTVVSGAVPRRVTVAIEKLPAGLVYTAVPKLQPYVYLEAVCRNMTAGHFLGGPVNIFLGGDFLGASRLETVAPGQEFRLSMGVDERMKIKREKILEKSRESFSGRKIVLTQGFRITLENYTGSLQTVTVVDQVPVSQDASIEVKNLRADPEVTEMLGERGELRWKVDIATAGKKIIEFSYVVVFPEAFSAQPGALDAVRRSAATY